MSAAPNHATGHEVPPKAPELKPVVGTGMARFLNQYNPQFDKPYERPNPNQGRQLDPELTAALEAERIETNKSHNRRRDWIKAYMDECVKFAAITKGKK